MNFDLDLIKVSSISKEKMEKWNGALILKQDFKVEDWVLLYNSPYRFFHENLKGKRSIPSNVMQVFMNGAIEVEDQNEPLIK